MILEKGLREAVYGSRIFHITRFNRKRCLLYYRTLVDYQFRWGYLLCELWVEKMKKRHLKKFWKKISIQNQKILLDYKSSGFLVIKGMEPIKVIDVKITINK